MFGIGYSRFAPGTLASFVTCLIFYSLYRIGYLESRGIILIYIVVTIFFLSILLVDKLSSHFTNVDAKEIVIDEFVGQNIPLFYILFIPLDTSTYGKDLLVLIFLSFLFFRFFDIFKPYPIYLIDKKMKNGLGVMLDDVIAGIFSALLIYVVTLLWF